MSNEPLTLVVGRTYRAKRPAPCQAPGFFRQQIVNDRTIIFIGLDTVQYDGPAVADGRHYPKVTIEAFRKWAARDVTDELPAGEYAKWPIK